MKKYGPLNSGEVITTCVDTDSSATSNHPVRGNVVGVYIDPDISCASAPTVTITTVSDPPVTILAVTVEAAGWYYPRTPIHDPDDGSVISSVYSQGIPIDDFVNVALTNAEEGDNVDIWLMLD